MGVLDHFEEAPLLADAINGPVRIKDMMSAVFRVDLSKHEEFNIVLI